MAEPSSKDDDLEQFSLWQLLNTPIGDLNNQPAPTAGQPGISKLPKTPDKFDDEPEEEPESQLGRFAKKVKSERRKRGFAKRHSASQGPNSNRKQHNFRDTTKKIGFHSDFESSPIGQSDTRTKSDGKSLYKPGFFTLAIGVILPIAAMVFESTTHYMAQTAFDPFPTPNHLLLFALIPISNFMNWLAVRYNLAPFYSIISLSTGMALGIAILYSVMLLPLTPQFMFQTLMGGGILGLAPLMSIPITMLCGNTICQLADRHKTFFDAHQLKHLGHLIILVMVLCVELPSTLTRMHLSAADRGDRAAIQWLRQWGNKEVLLRACYERSGEATDILGTLAEQQHPVSVSRARELFYSVTGVSFNSVPLPASFRGTIKHAGLIDDPAGLNDGVKDEFDLDPDIAGELVSGVARGLSVSNSDISGSLDSSRGVASLDWNFTFENVSTIPREARAKILLPPNAVVTKATLWLDDLQRETVIQERDLARNTYVQSVTNHKRDPLLVSMAGKDSVLVQCYPVVKGTKTKIRLHIVAPLVVASKTEESLIMPTFEERNFAITIPHHIDLSSKSKISLNGTDSQANGKVTQLKKELDNSVMSRFEAVAKVAMTNDESSQSLAIRPPQSIAEIHKEYFSLLPETAIGPGVGAMALSNNLNSHRGLTVVIDKSVTMSQYMPEIAKGLKSAPKSLPITLVEVKDGWNIFCKSIHSDQADFEQALKSLAESKCEGGQNDGNALLSVLAEANSSSAPAVNRTDVLWIHAAQPLSFYNVEQLRNILLSPHPGAASLYDLQVASGPNQILPTSYDYPKLQRIVRTGLLSDDISTFIENYSKNQIRRPATMFGLKATGTATGANTELAQVQAYKLAMGRYQSGDKWGAYDLAARYHLVTPVSSAVVTEEVPIVADKVQELAEKKAIDQLAKDMELPLAESPSMPLSAPKNAERGSLNSTRFNYEPQKWKSSRKAEFNSNKLDKTRFYNAPRQIQIIDERPVVADFRQRGEVNGASDSLYSKRESSVQKQLQSYPMEMEKGSAFQRLNPNQSVLKNKEGNLNMSSGGSGGSFGDAFSSSAVDGPVNNTWANTNNQASPHDGSIVAAAPPPPPTGVTLATGPVSGLIAKSRVPSRSDARTLMGATNGTIGPQSGDASSIMGDEGATRDFGAVKKQIRRSGIPNLQAYGVNTAGTVAGTSPFSNVMTKLNSLSVAAGSSTPGSAGIEDYNPYSNRPSSPYEQQKNSYQNTTLKSTGLLDATWIALVLVGFAFTGMLVVFLRLLAQMKNDNTPKGPIQ